MKELRTVTLLEGLLANDPDIRAYSRNALVKRVGMEVTESVTKAWRDGKSLPASFADQECRNMWKNAKTPFYMSVSSIMDFYERGPESLLGCIKGQMILSHKNFIYYIMKHYFAVFMPDYSEDLYSCGVVGLLKAMHEYNGQNAFTTYSKFFIIHEMAEFTYYLQGNPSCYYAKLQKQIRSAMDDGYGINVGDIANRTGIKQDIIIRELRAMRAAEFVCLDEYPALKDTIEDRGESVEDAVETRVMLSVLEDAIRGLGQEDRELLSMCFWQGYSIGRIAREKGVGYSRVKKQYRETLDRLRRELG